MLRFICTINKDTQKRQQSHKKLSNKANKMKKKHLSYNSNIVMIRFDYTLVTSFSIAIYEEKIEFKYLPQNLLVTKFLVKSYYTVNMVQLS